MVSGKPVKRRRVGLPMGNFVQPWLNRGQSVETGRKPAQPGSHALGQSRLDLTCKVELSVERSQHLDGFDSAIVPNNLAAITDKLVGKVFERVGELFQRATGLRSDSSTDIFPTASSPSPLERFHQKVRMIILNCRPGGGLTLRKILTCFGKQFLMWRKSSCPALTVRKRYRQHLQRLM